MRFIFRIRLIIKLILHGYKYKISILNLLFFEFEGEFGYIGTSGKLGQVTTLLKSAKSKLGINVFLWHVSMLLIRIL